MTARSGARESHSRGVAGQTGARTHALRRLGLGAAIVLVVAGLAYVWFSSSPSFQVHRLLLPTLNHVTQAQIEKALAEAQGQNLLELDIAELETKLEAIPYVAEAHVSRRFPDALEVTITEYEAVARLQASDGGEWLLSGDGRVLERETGEHGKLLLFILGGALSVESGTRLPTEAAKAVGLAVLVRDPSVWPANHPLARVELRAGTVVAVLGGGAELRLGKADQLEEKLRVCAEIIDQYSRQGRPLDYVDAAQVTRVVARARAS